MGGQVLGMIKIKAEGSIFSQNMNA